METKNLQSLKKDLNQKDLKWILPLLTPTVDFFKYHPASATWYGGEGIKKLLAKGENQGSDQETLNQVVESFLRSGDVEFVKEILLDNGEYSWLTFIIKGEKVMDEQGTIHSIRGICIEAPQYFYSEQDQMLKSLGELLLGVSHDMNNQLNCITGNLILAKEQIEDVKTLNYLKNIEKAAKDSIVLADKLLNYTRQDDPKKYIDLSKTVEDLVSLLKVTADRRLELNIAAHEYSILGNHSMLTNAMLNIYKNAREATSKKGCIEFSLTRRFLENIPGNRANTKVAANEYAILAISDTGSGIEPELLTKMFKPFFTTKIAGAGNGIGLAEVMRTVNDHRGALTVESEVGKGATFTLYFPINEGEYEETLEEEVVFGSGNILLVDDNEANLNVTKALIVDLGYEVTEYVDPRLFIDYYQKNWERYDCVILNAMMPIISGDVVFRFIKSINKQSKVLLTTGIKDLEQLDFVLRHGVDAYLFKPMPRGSLSQKIYHAINGESYVPKLMDRKKILNAELTGQTTLEISRALEGLASNPKLYFMIAHQFRKQCCLFPEELKQLFKTNLMEALRQLRFIQEGAKQLGARELYDYSCELEKTLEENGEYDCLLKLMLEELVDVMEELFKLECR